MTHGSWVKSEVGHPGHGSVGVAHSLLWWKLSATCACCIFVWFNAKARYANGIQSHLNFVIFYDECIQLHISCWWDIHYEYASVGSLCSITSAYPCYFVCVSELNNLVLPGICAYNTWTGSTYARYRSTHESQHVAYYSLGTRKVV